MADEAEERTEQPTRRRREEARRDGRVVTSREAGTFAVMLGGFAILSFSGFYISRELAGFMTEAMRMPRMMGSGLNTGDMSRLFTEAYGVMTRAFLPVLVLPVFAAIAGVLVHGVTFSAKPLKPDPGRLSPAKGIKKIFSLDTVSEFVKSVFKIGVLTLVAVLAVRGRWAEIAAFNHLGVAGFALQSGRIMLIVISRTLWVLAFLAVGDYLYQKWRFEKGLRMSRQEIKEETRYTEGDPFVKSRIRSVQRELAERRMMEGVLRADVVITETRRLAVALRYEREKSGALSVVEKGRGLKAARIRERAVERGMPLVEDKRLAKRLYRFAETGREIPPDLYKAVAGVLASVYGRRKRER